MEKRSKEERLSAAWERYIKKVAPVIKAYNDGIAPHYQKYKEECKEIIEGD